MGKVPIALVIVAFQLWPLVSLQADEQVRHLQEELRKRHLFYGNLDGEFTPALVTALSRYQNKKGLAVTGLLDSETCASLGIPPPAPRVEPTPFVVAKTGDVRGVNGELLPSSTPLFAMATDCTLRDDSQVIDAKAVAPAPATKSPEEIQSVGTRAKPRSRTPARRTNAHRQTNPFILAYQSADHALKLMFRDGSSRKKRDPKKRG